MSVSEAHNCCPHDQQQQPWVKLWMHTGHLHIEGRKMSKSLKNFISIGEYFEQRLSNNPCDDFRLFCLHFKYSSSLNYSAARIAVATQYRAKVESFVQFVMVLLKAHRDSSNNNSDNKGDGVGGSRKSTAESRGLEASLRRVRSEVQLALCNDFDTPRVLSVLSSLIGEATTYSQQCMEQISGTNRVTSTSSGSEQQQQQPQCHPIEPVVSVTRYLVGVYSMLGLQFASRLDVNQAIRATTSSSSSDSEGVGGVGGGVGLSEEAIDSILHFRSKVRQGAAGGLKVLKKHKQAPSHSSSISSEVVGEVEASLKGLLSQCDEARDSWERHLRIKIDDIAVDKSKWRPV